jgi:hypothetical protein
VRSHEETHGNDLQEHLSGVDEQEDKVDGSIVLGDTVHLLVERQEEAVNHNDDQDEPIEPGVDSHNLNDLVSEWIGHRQAAEGDRGIVLLLVSSRWQVFIVWIRRHCLFHGFHRLDPELAKGEAGNLSKEGLEKLGL